MKEEQTGDRRRGQRCEAAATQQGQGGLIFLLRGDGKPLEGFKQGSLDIFKDPLGLFTKMVTKAKKETPVPPKAKAKAQRQRKQRCKVSIATQKTLTCNPASEVTQDTEAVQAAYISSEEHPQEKQA